MVNNKKMMGIFSKIFKKGPMIGAILLVGMMFFAPITCAAKGGTISGTIYNSNSYTLGQVKVELFNYINVSTLHTASSLQSDSLVETERTWSCVTPLFTNPLGIPSSSPIYSDTTPTNTKPPNLGISNNPQNNDAIDTNLPFSNTASSVPQISNSTAMNTKPFGSAGIDPQKANTTATNLAPMGSTMAINSQTSNTTATNTSPSGTTATIMPQSSNTTAINTKPTGLLSPINQTYNATVTFTKPSGTVMINMNPEDASSTAIKPPGALGSKSGTWYNGSFILEGDDDGNGIAEETIYWILTDNVTAGVYDLMNLSYEDSTNYNDGNMADQFVGLWNDEAITGEKNLILGTYHFIVNFTSDPSASSPDAWIISKEWYTGSFSLDLDGDGSVGGTEIFYYSLNDNNSDGMYDSMDLSTDDDIFGEGTLTDGNTTTDNDELIAIGGTDVRLGTYLFLVNFVENPNSSDSDATIQSSEWFTGSFNIDADDDGLAGDIIYFTLSDMNSEGLYDTMDLSFDTTYGEGIPNDDNVTISNDESITANDFLTLGNSIEFLVSFDPSPIPDSDDARIESNEWYKGTFSIDGDGDGVLEMNNVYYVLTDTDSNGIYEAMDISIGDQVYGEGDVGDFYVDFNNIDNTDDELVRTPKNITLGDYYLFTVGFDENPNMDSDDARITSIEWYEGSFLIDADGDGSSDDNVLFILTDSNSDGLYEAMDISIGDSFYGEGDLNDFIVDFDALDNINDERITTSTNITLGDNYLFSVDFDQGPNANSSDAEITCMEWYEGSFVIDADNDGTADDGVYFVLSDTNSNGIYDTMDISIEDQVYGEIGGGTLSDNIVNYVSPGNNDNDEQINGISSVTLGDSLLFYVDFDPTPTADAIDAGVLIYEWYYGSFEMDADDLDDDGVIDDDVYYVLTDTDSNGLYDTMDISINDIIFGEVGGGGLFDGKVDYVTDTNNLDDERITITSNVTLGDSLLFTIEFDNNPDNSDQNDARILSIEWYTGNFSIDVDGDGSVDANGVNFALSDFNSQGLYNYYMEITTDDITYAEGILWNQTTGLDDDEIIFETTGEFVRLGAHNYSVRSYDDLNDGLDVNDGVNYDVRDAKIIINQWFTGNALLEGNLRNAVVADSDSDGVFDEMYIDINDNGVFGDIGIDAIAVQVSGTFQGSLLDLQYTVVSIDPTRRYFEIQPTGASLGFTTSWFIGQIEAPSLSGDWYNLVLSDVNGDSVFETADFDTDLPGDSLVDSIGLTEIFGTVYLGSDNYQVVNIEDSGAYVRISSYLDAVLDSDNDISLTNKFHYGIISESSLTLNLNQDGDITDTYHTIVVDNVVPGKYETVFIDTDDDDRLSDQSLLLIGDSFFMETDPPFEPHMFEMNFISSSGNYYILRQANHPVDTYISDADGFYTLDAPTDGDYWIKVTNSTTSWGYAKIYDTNSNIGINVVNGNLLEDWDFYLSQTGNFISGFVNDSSIHNPIKDAIVEVYDNSEKLIASTMTKTDGSYLIAVEFDAYYDMVYRMQGYYTDDGRTTGTWQDFFLLDDTCSIDVLLVPDDVPPNIALDYPFEGQTVGGSIDVTATATDDFLMEAVEVSFDYGTTYHVMTSSGINTYTYPWDTTTYLEGIHRIIVRAIDHGGYIDTDFNDVYVSNDGTPPSVMIVSPLDLEYVEGSHVIQIFAIDNYALQYVNVTLNGTIYPTAFNPSSGYYEFQINTTILSDGIYTLSAEAKDYAGNSATDSLVPGFYVDNNAPTLSIFSPNNAELLSGSSVYIDIESEDPGVFVPTVQYRIDNGPWIALSGSEFLGWADIWDSTTVSDGLHMLTFRSYDSIGHVTSDSITITVDNNNPTASIVSPLTNECLEGTYKFKVYAMDSVEVKNVYISINSLDYIAGYNSISGFWEVEIDTTTIPDGSYDITATVEDGVSGHIQNTMPFNINIDNNAPTLSVNSPSNGEVVYGELVLVDADSTDEGVSIPVVQYKIDSGAWNTLTGSEAIGWTDYWNSSTVSNGIHTITYRACDAIGHLITESITIKVDNDKPSVYLATPVPGEYIHGTYSFKISAFDAVTVTKVYITINGTDYIAGFSTASGYWEVIIDTNTLPDGTYGITATVEDGILGHTRTTTPFSFNVDNNEPTLSIDSPINGATLHGFPISIHAISTDKGAFVPIVEYRVDSGPWFALTGSEALGWTGSWDSTTVTNGFHTMTFRAYDTIGHFVTSSITITVDNDKPIAMIAAPVASQYVEGTYTFRASASDAIGITNLYFTINGIDYNTGYNPASGYWEVAIDTTVIPDGAYIITATVEDGIINHTQTTVPFNFNIDNNAPTLSINSPLPDALVFGNSVSIDVHSSDNGAFVPIVQYKIDSGAWVTLSGSEALGWKGTWNSSTVSNGLHTLTFKAYDNIGHITTDSVTIMVDNDYPIANIVAPVLGEYIQGGYTFKIQASDAVEVKNVYISINGMHYFAGYNPANSLWEVEIDTRTISDGTYDIIATVEDGITTHIQTTTPFNFNIDNNAPTLSVNYPSNNEILYGDTVLIYAESTDVGAYIPTVQYRIDGGAWITLTGSEISGWTGFCDSKSLSNGNHLMTFRAYDAIGHMVSETVTIIVDNDNPKVSIVAPVPDEYVQGSYLFKVFASDAVVVKNVFFTIGGIDYIAGFNSLNDFWEVSIDTKTILDDTYEITATAEDGIPSHSQTTSSLTFQIDNNAPQMIINWPLEGDHIRGVVNLDLKGNDLFMDRVEYNVDGTGWIENITAWDTTKLADGSHTLMIRVLDLAGHTVQETISITVDNMDTDSDGIGDLADPDIDGDNVYNAQDAYPYDPAEWIDTDGDNIGDNADDDDDGDGVLDLNDDFPLIYNENRDTDGDGIGDNSDIDIDGDGVYNMNDAFPYNSSEWSDIDGDGEGDNVDEDMDGDGVLNKDDAFPKNPFEWRQSDNDGIGDNADEDDDGDGVPDSNDAFPLDPDEWFDTDKDGVGDNLDDDVDGDGISNNEDEFPYNFNEWKDTDDDGIGNNADPDDDNDGIVDEKDYYPLDKSRYLEPFWWWWILIAVLLVILIVVLFVTFIIKRKHYDDLGPEERYEILHEPAFKEPSSKEYEEKLEQEIREPRPPTEEKTKLYSVEELKAMRKYELVKMAGEMGLSTDGTKVAIIGRIRGAQIERMVEEAEKAEEGREIVGEEEIECPSCGMSFRVEVKDFPTVIECPHCGTAGTIN